MCNMKAIIAIFIFAVSLNSWGNCAPSVNDVKAKLFQSEGYQGLLLKVFLTSLDTEKRWAFSSDGWEILWIEKLVKSGEKSREEADKIIDVIGEERNRIFEEIDKIQKNLECFSLYYVVATTEDGVEKKRGYLVFWKEPSGVIKHSKIIF